MGHSSKSHRSHNAHQAATAIDTLAYLRMSKDDQDGSLDQQAAWVKDVAARDGLNVVKVFSDPGISGSEIELRPGLQSLLDQAEQLFQRGTPAKRVLCWKPNRLSRADSCDTHALVIRPLRQAGILHVQTRDEHLIDLHNRRDLLLFNIEQDAYSAEYLSSLAADTLRGQADTARQGYWNGGPAPIGYRILRTGEATGRRKLARLILGPVGERELVLTIFREYYETEVGLTFLARELTRRGFKPPRAVTWSANGLHSILTNRAYIGEVHWNRRHIGKHARLSAGAIRPADERTREETKRRKGLKTLPADWNGEGDCIIVANAHPAIVDADLFNAVQRKLTRGDSTRRPVEERMWELADLMTCGHCGAKCWCIPDRRTANRTRLKVECSRHRREGKDACPQSATAHHHDILTRVLTTLQRDLSGPGARERIRRALKARLKDSQARTQTARDVILAEVEALEAKRSAEARRLLELPSSVLQSATEAHELTLAALDQARVRLAAIADQAEANPAGLNLAERALDLVDELPGLVERIGKAQAAIDRGEGTVEPAELLALRRKVRDALFALVGSVRVTWEPLATCRRGRRNKSSRWAQVKDVETVLLPHVQAVLLHDVPNGRECRRSSAHCDVTEPIVLSYNRPFAA